MIYADYNATAPLRPEARAAVVRALEIGANPSSVHRPGRAARKIMETARGQIARAINAQARDLVFTSGGTEANALALNAFSGKVDRNFTLIVSAVEHEAVSSNAERLCSHVQTARVTSDGVLDLDWLAAYLHKWDSGRNGRPVLALMLANNETGVIQPVARAAAMVRAVGGFTHCDAVQGLGKIAIDAVALDVDYLALSAHKIGGPQGVGALWVRPGVPLVPVFFGGGQEHSCRSGTENLGGIAGFGAAAQACIRDMPALQGLATARDAMEAALKAEMDITVFGENAPRLAQTSCLAFTGFASEVQLVAMDLAGIAVSSGSACSSGKVSHSRTLAAMGVCNSLVGSAIRFSFGWQSRPSDFERAGDVWLAVAHRATKARQARAV